MFKWQQGTEGGNYKKMSLLNLSFLDISLLKCSEEEAINNHIDHNINKRKYFKIQFNIFKAIEGGHFACEKTVLNWNRIKIYEPTKYMHSVSYVLKGERLDLVIGFGI